MPADPPPYPAGGGTPKAEEDVDVGTCKKAQACFPFWPLVAMALFIGGHVVLFLGFGRFLDAIDMYETAMNWATTDPFSSPIVIYALVAAGLIIATELALFYSSWTHALRLANIHCCKNKEWYRACAGSEDRSKEEKGSLLCLELTCIAYNHFLVLIAWLAVIGLIVQTAVAAVAGTAVVLVAGMCTINIGVLQTVAEKLNEPPFSANIDIDIVQFENTVCNDPTALAISGAWMASGPPIVLFSQVILLVCYVAVWKAHSHHTDHVNKRADKLTVSVAKNAV